jgi:fatty-acyl-CoA synthase
VTFPFADWVAHHARNRPRNIALRGLDNGDTRSWAALEQRVARQAGALLGELGLRRGDRVAVLAEGNIRVLELQYACMRAGLTMVPLNFRLTVSELSDMCRRLSPSLMITDKVWKDSASRVALEAGIARTIDWDGPLSVFETLATDAAPMAGREDMRGDEVPLILFTSGSTGAPKAATCTLEAMVWQAFNQAGSSRVAEEGSHVFVPLPLFHAGGLNSLTNPVLFFGGKATFSARFDAGVAARFIGDPANGVTHLALVPLMYDLIAATPDFEAADLRAMRTAIVAGGRMSASLQQRYLAKGVAFSPQYGGTETGPSVTALHPSEIERARDGSCGTKVMHVQIRLVGEDGADVPVGKPGEIWVKGPAITRGYIDRATELDFVDGWFRTGDVARVDDAGFYTIVDRLKDMYKSGGENVSSAEVEQVLATHPDVRDVAVIGVHDDMWGEVGMAVVVPRDGAELTLESLRALCEGRLARFKQPRRMELVAELPRNVTGKVSKVALRRQFHGTATA